MKKKNKLVNKVKRLLKRIGCPRWFHHFGPKKYLSWKLLLGLFIKEVFRLSYRRATKFLDEFYNYKPHWTTLQKFRQRMPLGFWQKLLNITIEGDIKISAIDGSSLQRSNPSSHYLKRIDRIDNIAVPVYINTMVDVVRRKFISVRHHVKKSGEVKDVKYLVEQVKKEIELILMDKLYDSEKLHQYLRGEGILSIAPVKKNWSKGQLRKQLKECFDYTLYWQRNIVECLFSAFKRLFGNNLRSFSSRNQKAEVYLRMTAYNLGFVKKMIFY